MKRLHRFGTTIIVTVFTCLTINAQKVGIGTTSPGEKLHVVGKVKAEVGGFGFIQNLGTTTVATYVDGSYGAFGTVSNHPLFFFTNGSTPAMTILNGTENVGIGTTNPTDRLTLQSTSTSVLGLLGPGAYGSQARISFGDVNRCYIEEDTDDNMMIYGLSRTAIMGGNVGIGMTTPSSKLHVQDIHLTEPSLKVTKNYVAGGNANVPAIYGENAVDDFYGIGVYGKGGYVGVYGESDQDGGSNNYFGMYARAHGTNTGSNIGVTGTADSGMFNYGVFGVAEGSHTNYGVYGQASGGTTNYAGYFLGNTHVEGNANVEGDGVFQSSSVISPGLSCIKTYSTGSDANIPAIAGQNTVDDGYGIGVFGQGGATGVLGWAEGSGTGPAVGVQGTASGASSNYGMLAESEDDGASHNYGVRGEVSGASFTNTAIDGIATGDGLKTGVSGTATGSGNNIGVYSSAEGGSINYAGYFAAGNVYVRDNVGVGDFADSYKFRIKHGTYGLKIQHTSSSNFWEFYHAGSGDNAMQLYTNVGYVGGFNYTTGAYTSVSDRRLKENIAPMSSVLSKVMKLQPRSYTFKTDADQRPCLGFIAQDVEEIFPQLVTPPSTDGERETAYTMDYSGFGVLAIKAIQEQQEIIDAQEERITKLEVLVAELLKKGEQQVQPGQ